MSDTEHDPGGHDRDAEEGAPGELKRHRDQSRDIREGCADAAGSADTRDEDGT